MMGWIKVAFSGLSVMLVCALTKIVYKFYDKKRVKCCCDNGERTDLVVFLPDEGLLFRRHSMVDNSSGRRTPKTAHILLDHIGRNCFFTLPESLLGSTSIVFLIDFIVGACWSLDICMLIFTLPDLREAIVTAKRRGVRVRVIIDKTMALCDGSQIPFLLQNNIPVYYSVKSGIMHHKFVLRDTISPDDKLSTLQDQRSSVNSRSGSVSCRSSSGLGSSNQESACSGYTLHPLTESLKFFDGSAKGRFTVLKSYFASCRPSIAYGSFNWTWSAVTSNNEDLTFTDNERIVNAFKGEFEKLWTEIGNYNEGVIT